MIETPYLFFNFMLFVIIGLVFIALIIGLVVIALFSGAFKMVKATIRAGSPDDPTDPEPTPEDFN